MATYHKIPKINAKNGNIYVAMDVQQKTKIMYASPLKFCFAYHAKKFKIAYELRKHVHFYSL